MVEITYLKKEVEDDSPCDFHNPDNTMKLSMCKQEMEQLINTLKDILNKWENE